MLLMQNPKYFNIRRNYLGIPADFFGSAREYNEILTTNPTLKCDTKKPDLEGYSIILRDKLSFDSSSVVILNNDDYIPLLHTVGVWATDLMKEYSQDLDFCFIRWPQQIVDTASIDSSEVGTEVQTFMLVWGAHDIDNLSEFLRFSSKNVMLVFVTQTGFKEIVRSRLESSTGNIRIEEVSIEAIDDRPVPPDEKAKHQEKVKTIVDELLDLMLRYEALIYFYSPVNLDDQRKIEKISALLQADNKKIEQLNELLIKSDLAAITGRILWLTQPIVAKELLNDFISKDIISVSDLLIG